MADFSQCRQIARKSPFERYSARFFWRCCAIILFTSLGGTSFPWMSPVILGLIGAGILTTVAFILVEMRTREPILPMGLFAIRNFAVASGVGLIRPVFLTAAAVSASGFALTWLLREHPLRGGAPAEGLGESFAMPRDATSIEELARILAVLVAHENRWRVYDDLARRAGLDLPDQRSRSSSEVGEC